MTIEEAQSTIDNWIKTTGVRYFNELTNMAILTEEVGEVARIIARQYGEQSFKKSDEGKVLADELADVFIYLLRIADVSGIDILKASQEKMQKNSARYTVQKSFGNADKQ